MVNSFMTTKMTVYASTMLLKDSGFSEPIQPQPAHRHRQPAHQHQQPALPARLPARPVRPARPAHQQRQLFSVL